MEKLFLKTSKRVEFIDITERIQEIVSKKKIENTVLTVFVPHTTAGVTINEDADPDVVRDIISALDRLAPESRDYAHSEGNADAHIKSSVMGCSLSVIVEKGNLVLGTWQGIYFTEFDGPRSREVWIKIQ